MLVMHEPMNTSSIFAPATSDSVFTSSGSFGQATIGSCDLGEVDLDHRGVLGVRVGLRAASGRRARPPARRCGAAGCARRHSRCAIIHFISATLLLMYSMIGSLFRCTVQPAARALGRRVGQLERLLDLQVRQALDLEDAAARRCSSCPSSRPSAGPALIAYSGIALTRSRKRDAGLHLALEAHQHALGHVERHHAGGGGEGDQARSRPGS